MAGALAIVLEAVMRVSFETGGRGSAGADRASRDGTGDHRVIAVARRAASALEAAPRTIALSERACDAVA